VINTIDQYVWSFGEQVLNIARESLKLRYRLLPYIYSSFVIASETGAPIQEPMIYNDQWDTNLWNIDDQYMFGPNLLVAPIYEPGKTSRSVYLPRGEWFDWHTGEHFVSEGRYVVVDAPLEKIPMFARAGAVIPMLSDAPQNTHNLAPKQLELHVFLPEAEGAYRSLLQEDDGLTFDSLDGKHVRTEFKVVRAADRSLLEANTTGKGFSAFAREGFDLVWHTARGVTRSSFENNGEGFSVFGTELAEGSALVVVSQKPKKKRRR
jgi:alpha-glucosidase